MKIVVKILKLAAILILVLSVILFAAARVMQDKVAAIMLKSLNHNISTKVHAGAFSLSFLSKFPRASLEMSNVTVLSSPGFNSAAFPGVNTDTLLSARSISVEFRLTAMLGGNYTIERIRVKSGRINFFTDKEGRVNYDIASGSKTESSDFTIDLEKVYLSDIRANYNNLANSLNISGSVRKGTLKSRIHGDFIGFSAGGNVQIDSIRLYSTFIRRTILADADIDLQKTKYGISFRKGSLHIDNYDFGLDGTISSDNVYDLKITGRNIDISKIRNYLPDSYQEVLSGYDTRGTLVLESRIKGQMNRTSNPHAEVNFHLDKGRITSGKSNVAIKNLNFDGSYSNGTGNRPETAVLKISGLQATMGSATYTGSVSFSRLNDPIIEFAIKGRVIPSEVRDFFGLTNISTASGSADADLRFSGRIDFRRTFGFSEFLELEPQGTLDFNSMGIGFNSNSFLANDVTGSLSFNGPIVAKNLRFLYKGQRISVSGEFRNLPQWLYGKPVQLAAAADVSFDRLIPGAFFPGSSGSGKSGTGKKGFKLPDDLTLDINFRIDSLTYKTFSSSAITGTLNYKPRLLTFKSFNMKALKGSISGNGFILQNYNKSVLSKGIFDVSNVDVNKAFTAFQNFGQNFLKAENIAGSLSGSFSLLLPLDSMLNPQVSSLTAEGKYMLVSGALINFDPVKELSSFIELSELENIHFQKMENDFFIRNNYVFIPQMEVRSSAVDLSVNGRHSFDNDYEYHVKVLLSEILSRKRKQNKKSVTEFGSVQDDGLGRTSMLLKVVYKGEDIRVSYDMKAAAGEVKENLKTERKNLKSILNQEYGWYSKDSADMRKPAEKKRKFNVTWDDK